MTDKREIYIASNAIADAIVKAEWLDTNDLDALYIDIQRWRDDPSDPGDVLLDAYQVYIRALQDAIKPDNEFDNAAEYVASTCEKLLNI